MISKRMRQSTKVTGVTYNRAPQINAQRPSGYQGNSNRALIEQRRAAGQCFKCGDKYHPGHVCAVKTLNALYGINDILEVYYEDCLQEETVEEECEEMVEEGSKPEVGVYIHALSGEKPQNTIKVREEVNGQMLTILVDTSSTHSFMDLHMAKEIKAHMIAAAPLVVTVANGQKVLSKLQCPSFQWNMQGHNFQADLRIIRLEGPHMVLGIDWLRSYGKVTFDYHQDSITIQQNGQPLILKGIQEGAQLKLISAGQWYQEWQKGECCIVSQCQASEEQEIASQLNPKIQAVLDQYATVFENRTELPPQRSVDHRIPLQPGATPVNLRPYRHSHEQKGEIERQVKEMMESSIIQASHSPFASPVLLVKKKDGS